FGFDGGFFIYTPLCLLFLGGLLITYRQNKFSFWSATIFLFSLMFFFSCYWGYTYFDGFGIRVLVDYFSFFAFLGSRFFTYAEGKVVLQNSLLTMSAILL